MHFIDRLKKNPSMLEGRNFTELLLYLCQLSLLSHRDVDAIQNSPKFEQAVCLLDLLEKANRHKDSDDVLSTFIEALLKANYKALANYLSTDHRDSRTGRDSVDGGPTSNAGLPIKNDSNGSQSASTRTYSRESGLTSEQMSYVSVSASKPKFVDRYRHMYNKVLYNSTSLDSEERESLTEHALTELHANKSVWDFVCKYTWLLKNVLTKASEYYNQAAKAFRLLETFGQAILRFPWKSELRKISKVSGAYKLRISPYVTDASVVLADMGFVEQHDDDNFFLLVGSIDRTRTMEASYQCFLMEVRCRYLSESEETMILRDVNSTSDAVSRYKSRGPSGATHLGASTKSRDSGYVSNMLPFQNVADGYLRDSAPVTRRAPMASSPYYSNVNADTTLGSFRSKSSSATTGATLLVEAPQTVKVDHTSIDLITRYMAGIPDEGMSTLLRLPSATTRN